MPQVLSVNLGRARPNPYKESRSTGIGKEPRSGPIEVRAPGPKDTGAGSGIVGDFLGDRRHHGGDRQAVYAFQREDLDSWADELGRDLANGCFGENLTTEGIDVNRARIGERWRIGDDVILQVTDPRIPCSTFRGWIDEKGWLKTFTARARPGAYLAVVEPGHIRAGDVIEVTSRPAHDVTVSDVFRALTTEPSMLPGLLPAGDDLGAETLAAIEAWPGSPA